MESPRDGEGLRSIFVVHGESQGVSRLTGKSEFLRLRGLLQASTGRDFERLILPVIRFLVPHAFGTPALGDFDKLGMDLLAWSGDGGLALVVQCKAFKATETELGPDQVAQCLESIEKFAASGYEAKLYLLIHNRLGKSEVFRGQVSARIDELVASGQVLRAELWSCDKVMAALAKAVRQRVLTSVYSKWAHGIGRPPTDEIVEVPVRRSTGVVDRHHLKSVGEEEERVTDPATEILSIGVGVNARGILLGEAGFGKTTAVMRAARSAQCRVYFMRAAALKGAPVSRHTLVEQFSFDEEILQSIPAEDIPTIEPLLKAAMESVFSMPSTRAMLIIDGLDESITLSRAGGLQWLMNSVEAYMIPVVLTCRTTFWRARATDFATAVGMRSPRPGTKQRDTPLSVMEMLPWNDEQILLLATRFRDTIEDHAARARVAEFVHLVENRRYSTLYGDIPRRPLFLRFILDTVAQQGAHAVGRIKLLEEWATMKIVRDYIEPLKHGPGRQPIVGEQGEALDVTVDLAFRAMMRAASLMTGIFDGKLELAPTCRVDGIVKAEDWLHTLRDPLGLFLNTLLEIVDGRGLSAHVRFGHQIFQEFFLAKFIEAHPDDFVCVKIPADVHQWLESSTAHQIAVYTS